MSTPDSPYPAGQQGQGGQSGYPPPQYQQGQGNQYQPGQYPPPQYQQQPQYQQNQYQQQPPYQQQGQPGQAGANGYAQYPQGGPYQQAGPYGAMPAGYMQPGYDAPFGPDGYLRGGPVSFGQSFRLAWQNKFNYQGRASRSAYWWYALFMFLVTVAVEIVVVIIAAAVKAPAIAIVLYLIWAIVAVIVGLPLAVRRLHDTDRSGWWLLLGFIPFGGLVVFVFSLLEGTRGPNRYA